MLDKLIADWINAFVGALLVISAMVLADTVNLIDVWTVVVLGLLIIAVSVWALSQATHQAAEWAKVVLGVLLFIAPWVMGYASHALASWNSWIVGVIVVVVAAYTFIPLSRSRGGPIPH